MSDEEVQSKREAILDAALEVFAAVGYERATIKAIAARAGMKSPALLYWYFPSKADIMRGVMSRFVPLIAPSADTHFLVNLPTEQFLRMFGGGLLAAYAANPKMALAFRLIFAEIMREASSSSEVLQAGPALLLGLLRENLKANIAAGRLRSHDVEVSSRMFIAALIIYILGTTVVPSMGEGLPPHADYTDAVIANLLDGLRPPKD